MKALVTANFTEEGLSRLRKYMEVVYEPWSETKHIITSDDMAEKLKELGADVVILEVDLCHEEVFETVDLKMIGCCRGDPLNVDVEMATEKGVPVFYTPGRNADAVADLTLGFMLCHARQIIRIHNMVTSGNYNPEDPEGFVKLFKSMTGFEMGSRTVGIVGLGAIGRGVAKRVRACGSKVLAFDPYVRQEVLDEYQAKKVDLPELFSESDFITIHAAVTDETEGMITRELIERMKPTAFFLNLARMELIDEDALYDTLRNKRIAGAGIDVFHSEPPQKEERLLHLDNVIVTPHIGGATTDVIHHQSDMIASDVEAFLKGERPKRMANPEVLNKKK